MIRNATFEEVSAMVEKKNPFFETEEVASFTECTGLMPALPKDGEQDENYAELYAIHKAERPCPKYRRR